MANKRATPQRNDGRAQEARQPFNLATMSGIFPGTRTQIFQRIQVQPLVDRAAPKPPARQWLQLLWPEQSHRCIAYLLAAGDEPEAAAPLFEIDVAPEPEAFHHQLDRALQEKGYQPRTCGSCHFWQSAGGVNPDQLSAGHCGWRVANPHATTPEQGERDEAEVPALLVAQSHLALPCPHWQLLASDARTPSTTSAPPAVPMRRAAEEAEIRLSIAQRLWRRFLRYRQQASARRGEIAVVDWTALLVERSGVGAGTEACFACQGRIANLGALTVATAEDDKQTFSIWRCRNCYSLYLNNWVDRWERLDNLETEESYYRVAPAEAFSLLALIHGHAGGEHPNRRHERTTERQVFLDFIADRVPLSHQIRQGR